MLRRVMQGMQSGDREGRRAHEDQAHGYSRVCGPYPASSSASASSAVT